MTEPNEAVTGESLDATEPPLRDTRIREGGGPPAGAAEGEEGMAGGLAKMAPDPISETTSPIGAPTDPGTAGSPGVYEPARTVSNTPPSATPPEIYATPGGTGSPHTARDVEPGTPGIPGTPVPEPLSGDLTPPEMPNGVRSGEAGARDIEEGAGIGVMTGGVTMGTSGTIGAKGAGASETEVTDRLTDSGAGITHANIGGADENTREERPNG